MSVRLAKTRNGLPGFDSADGSLVHLDRIQHPYGPCPAALDALRTAENGKSEDQSHRLCKRLGEVFHVPSQMISLSSTRDDAMDRVVQATDGPLVTFPPSAVASSTRVRWPSRTETWLNRAVGRTGRLTADLVADLPCEALAIVDAPSDPLGTLLSPADAVRIARACRLLLVDERFAEFAGMSLLSLATEFDNIVIVRSFEVWAGMAQAPCAWLVASPRVRAALGLESAVIDASIAGAALATLDDLASVEATLRLVRTERSQLFRLLRKISYLDPVPSWGPFVAARVAMGRRDHVVWALRERGILVHAPDQIGLEAFLRFGIGSRSEMDRLKEALLAIVPEVVA
jgi:histidinol-phosphate aminotransferase